jgi:nucleoside-diphosphate-sugar epimerase
MLSFVVFCAAGFRRNTQFSQIKRGAMRILIIGYGDVAQRFTTMLQNIPANLSVQWYALVRSAESAAHVRAAGGSPVLGDLDQFRSLGRLKGLAENVLYLAPPPAQGAHDPRLIRALAALRARRIVYVSTTGVYGDCQGAQIDETRPVHAESARAKRRVAAESLLRAKPAQWSIRLRVPGIYARDRLPVDRIVKGTPALAFEDDSYSNHIHADDLARILWLALFRGKSHRAYNTVDNANLKMGEWFDLVADAHGLPRVPKMSAAHIRGSVSPELWSFMRESRRIGNARLRTELRVRLQYPLPAPRG